MKVEQYKGHAFESDCVRTKEYISFERQCKKELKEQCVAAGFNLHSFHPNHFEWSAVLEKDGKFVYVSMPDVRFWKWYDEILIRTMAHDKDWTGGHNNRCSFNEIGKFATNLIKTQL